MGLGVVRRTTGPEETGMNKTIDVDPEPVQHIIITQGAVKVNDGYIHRRGDGVVCIYFDLESKRAEYGGVISSDEAPIVSLYANDETLHIDESRRDEPTLVAFPEFEGWQEFSGGVSRYTLALVLTDG